MTVLDLLASDSSIGAATAFPLPCPFCEKELFQRPPKKALQAVVCPHCGETTSEGTLEPLACDLQAEQASASTAICVIGNQIDSLRHRIARMGRFRLFSRRRALKQLAILETEHANLRGCLTRTEAKLQTCAIITYFLGNWYRSTRVPIAHALHAGSRKGVVPVLSEDGKLSLLAASESDLGAVGEFSVYRLVVERAALRKSSLHEAVIIPRAKLRWASSHGASLKLEEREVDCLVATQSCLFLVEVKTTNTHVLASSSRPRIAFSKNADVPCQLCLGREAGRITRRPFKKNTRILTQSAETARAVTRSSLPYPASRVRRVIIFVEPLSFANEDCGFCNNLFIGCTINGMQTFLGAMERESAALSTFLTREDLEELGGGALCKYSTAPEERAKSQAA